MTEKPTTITTLCIHKVLPNGIHEFKFTKANPAAVDQWMDYLVEIGNSLEEKRQQGDEQSVTLRYLVDVRNSGMFPLNYLFTRSKKLISEHPRLEGVRTRTAFVYDRSFLASMADTLSRLLHMGWNVTRFFHANKYDDAVVWLLADE